MTATKPSQTWFLFSAALPCLLRLGLCSYILSMGLCSFLTPLQPHPYVGADSDISTTTRAALPWVQKEQRLLGSSRDEVYHFPGRLCTHICIPSQLVSTLPVLFACLALEVACRAFCSPLPSPRRKVDGSDSNELPNANWQVVGVKGG